MKYASLVTGGFMVLYIDMEYLLGFHTFHVKATGWFCWVNLQIFDWF